MSGLQITETSINGVPALGLEGRIDVDTAPELRARMHKILPSKRPRLVLELAGVEYMDTGGLATLIEAQLNVRRREGDLYLLGLTDRILEVFSANRVTDMFTILEDEEALDADS